MKPDDPLGEELPVEEGGSFYQRWSERKQEARQPVIHEEPADEPPQPGDEDMPPLESLDEHSDYRGFLSPKVSEPLRQLALRKLFHGAAFNVCDGLDDYADDFTQFEALGDVLTADLRHRLEQEAKRKAAEDQDSAEAQASEASEQSDLPDTVQADASPAQPEGEQNSDVSKLDRDSGQPQQEIES